MNKNRLLFIGGIAIGLILIVFFGLTRFKPHTFHGTLLQSPSAASDFTLLTTQNQEVSLSDFKGKIVLLYFGYTFCPDVCPATLAELADAMTILGEDAEDVQIIFISVDPERDTPNDAAKYVNHFHPSFIGVTGEIEAVSTLATIYGIYFAKAEGSELTNYLIDHTATVVAINQDGYIKLYFPFGTTGEQFAADLDYLIHH